MTIYTISDTHFGHSMLVREQLRPFYSVEEMDQVMINRWNNTVKDNDEVYFVGDFSFSNKNRTEDIFNNLKGIKHLIVGNHDSKITRNLSWESIEKIKTLKYKNKFIVFCHYPIERWERSHYGAIHIHGHIHAHKIREVPNRINVSVDVINYTPISLDLIII